MICDGCTHAECCPAKEEHGGAKRCSAFKPQEMTNEEWLRSATTEQLAKWLAHHSRFIYECGEKKITPKIMHEEDWEWWLKQPHTIKE